MSMDIYSKPGTKVIFVHPNYGYSYDQEFAKKYLKRGQIYTVDHTVVDSHHTDVYLVGASDIAFNSVMFESVDEEEKSKMKNNQYVLVTGVFDLFHRGHLYMLDEASKLGNYLIVAIHTDE